MFVFDFDKVVNFSNAGTDVFCVCVRKPDHVCNIL